MYSWVVDEYHTISHITMQYYTLNLKLTRYLSNMKNINDHDLVRISDEARLFKNHHVLEIQAERIAHGNIKEADNDKLVRF